MPTQYLNIHQAAAQLGKSTKTVRKYIKDGKLQAVKENTPYGSQYLIPLEAITSMLNPANPTEKGMEALPEVTNLPSIPTPLEAIENMLLGVEGRMIKTMQEYQQNREDRLLEAIERLEVRVEELSLPWWKRVWKWLQ